MQLSRLFAIVAILVSLLSTSRAFAADDDAGAPADTSAQPGPAPEGSDARAPAPEGEADGGAPVAPEPGETTAPKSTSNITARASIDVGGYADSTATTVLTPSLSGTVESPTAGWAINGRYLVDVVSAASPDIVSTASPHWNEVRHAGNLGFRYKPKTFGVAANASTSYTPDYLSLSAGAQLTQELDDKNLTLVEGYGYGRDTIGRTGTPFSVFSHELEYHSISLGASRVVNQGLVIGLFGDAVLERGDQSKPYRYIPIFTPDVAATIPAGASASLVASSRMQARPLEQLPLERDRFAVTARLAWRGDSTTLRFEERGYTDSWGLRASTTDARYFIDLGRRVMIWPHGRFHVQNGVDFWKRAYSATSVHDLPALRTGDRELGPLFTAGGGGGLRIALGNAGALDDVAFTTTLDGFYTAFSDAIYVKERFSALVTTGLEVRF
ncbi:MAG: hypothetical protein JWP87_1479 [Labilithrix sp.]|nr:hypothetical protein [Labilithrix sp.]